MRTLEMLRVYAGMTRTELAKEAGIGRSRVGQIELGRVTPGPESVELAKLASTLGMNAEPVTLLDEVSEDVETAVMHAARKQGHR